MKNEVDIKFVYFDPFTRHEENKIKKIYQNNYYSNKVEKLLIYYNETQEE